jgi:hypothetical protein
VAGREGRREGEGAGEGERARGAFRGEVRSGGERSSEWAVMDGRIQQSTAPDDGTQVGMGESVGWVH